MTQSVACSIVVPSLTGDIDRLRASLREQSFQDFELIVVTGVKPAGRARNQGVQQARSDLLVFIDDDAYLGDRYTLERLMATLRDRPEFSVIGPAKMLPPDSTPFQRWVGRQVPRFIVEPTEALVETNPPVEQYGFSALSTTCVAVRRAAFEEAGGFDERLPTGEDTEFFYRLRKAGHRFAQAPGIWVCHYPPATLAVLLRKSFGYGVGHALEAWQQPSRGMKLLPLDSLRGKALALISPLLFLVSFLVTPYFYPKESFRLGWHPLKALASYATFLGYVYGWRQRRSLLGSPAAGFAAESLAPSDRMVASASSVLNTSSFFFVAAANYTYAGAMAWLLPVDSYGLLGLAQAVILIAAIVLNSSFSWELTRTISESGTASVHYRVAKTVLAANYTIAVGMILFLFVLHWFPDSVGIGDPVLALVAAEVFLLSGSAFLVGVLQGRFRFGAVAVGRSVEAIAKLGLGLAFVWLGLGLFGAVLGILIGTLISVIILAAQSRDFRFWQEPGWSGWSTHSAGLSILVGLGGATFLAQADLIALKVLSPPAISDTLMGYYQPAAVLSRIPVLLALTYGSTLFPYIAANTEGLRRFYLSRGLKYTLLFILPINLILFLGADLVMELFFPQTYWATAPLLRLVAVGSALAAVAHLLVIGLNASGRTKPAAVWVLVSTLVALPWFAIAVPANPLEGAATGMVVANAIACLGLGMLTQRLHPMLRLADAARYAGSLGALVLGWAIVPKHGDLLEAIAIGTGLFSYFAALGIFGLLAPIDIHTIARGVDMAKFPLARPIERGLSRLIFRLNSLFALPEERRALSRQD